MKKIILFILLLTASSGYAQDPYNLKVDSIKQVLKTYNNTLSSPFDDLFLNKRSQIDSLKIYLTETDQDTSRVQILNAVSGLYRSQPDSAMYYGQQALTLAKKINYVRGEIGAMLSISMALVELGNLPSGMNLILKAVRMAEDNRYFDQMARGENRMGSIHVQLDDFKTAIDYYQRSYKLYNEIGNQFWASALLSNIGHSYILFNIDHHLDSAITYISISLKNNDLVNTVAFWPTMFRRFGLIEETKGNSQLALENYGYGIQAGILNKDFRNTAYNLVHIANLYKELDQLDSAIIYAHQALEISQKNEIKRFVFESSEILAEAYKEKNEIRPAFDYQELMVKTKNELYSVENIHSMQTMIAMDAEYQQALVAEEIARTNQMKQYALLSGLGMLLLVGFILYRNNRQKQRANNTLTQTLSSLKSTQDQLIHAEKMASLGELTAGIAHEIQNPLNFVNNFSEINTELIDELKDELSKGNSKEAVEIADNLKTNENKIVEHGQRASDIVKGMLAHSRTEDGKKELTNINALADEYLRLAYHGLRAKDKSFNAEFEANLDENLPKINVVPQDIGRVLLNLINNAFQAVREVENPKVIITTSHQNDNLVIGVSDNGSGISEELKKKIFQPFFTTKPTGEGTGLGLSMSYDIVKAHGGDLKVESTHGKFSMFIINLPLT